MFSGDKPSSALDLSSVGYFGRSAARELLSFTAKTLAERTPPGTRHGVQDGHYTLYAFARPDGLCAVLAADGDYPQRVAYDLLRRAMEAHGEATPSLADLLSQYQNPAQADKLTAVQAALDETQAVLHSSIQEVLARGEALDVLVDSSDELSKQSKMFYRQARRTNQCCVVQ